MTTTAVDDQFAPEPIQELEQKHHDKIVGIIAEKIEAERRPAPHGWKLVPVAPTPEMLEAGAKQVDWYAHNALECYHAMLAAAPTPPAQVEPSDEEIDAIAASMPDGAGGMLKQWGYRQFARALLARYGRQQAETAEPAAQAPAADAQPGYAGVTVWVGDMKYTMAVPEQILGASRCDVLLECFQKARHAIDTAVRKEGRGDE